MIFFNCKMCIDNKPANFTPRQWGRFEILLERIEKTKIGSLKIYCVRHGIMLFETKIEMTPEVIRDDE